MRLLEEADFARGLAGLDLPQVDLAVALLWFRTRSSPSLCATATELGNLIHSHALTGPPNTSRLKVQLFFLEVLHRG